MFSPRQDRIHNVIVDLFVVLRDFLLFVIFAHSRAHDVSECNCKIVREERIVHASIILWCCITLKKRFYCL